MVIRALSTELDATLSGKIRSAQSSFPALMIGLLEFGTQERVKRSSVVTRSLENNLFRVRSMMLFGLQSHPLLSPLSLMTVESKFGISSSIHLAQWLPTLTNWMTVKPTIQHQRQLFVLAAHHQFYLLEMIRELLTSTDQRDLSTFKCQTKTNKTDCCKPLRRTISQQTRRRMLKQPSEPI